MRTLTGGYSGQEIDIETIKSCIGKGWHKLIEDLIEDLFNMGWTGRLTQVKEKFGGLRFYAMHVDEKMEERIDKAEKESLTICEECGKMGKLRKKNNWLYTACEECK